MLLVAQRFFLATILLATLAGQTPQAANNNVAAAMRDLAEYIHDARKLGLSDAELRQNALKAGWKSNMVEEALRAEPSKPASSPDQPQRPDRGVPEEYIIGESDVLQVTVWKESEVSVPSIVVRADGKVTLPLIKDVVVAGLTPAQAEQIITGKLKPFYNDPDVSVVIREVHSKRIYLVGAIRKQGVVELKYPMTVLQAITEAGGPTEFAKRAKIYILRTENGKQFRLNFNYDNVAQGKSEEQNVWVKPGDYIFVPQ